MVKVFFEIDGDEQVVTAAAGESVMQVAVRKGVARIVGECGGEMSCATCHVYHHDVGGFPPPSEEEQDLLELVEDRREQSRLGCQLVLAAGMTEVRVVVP